MTELFDFLIKNRITVATAESCTGGNIASEFVSYSGISEVFLAGFVTYANSAKENILSVKEDTLKKYGAVSYECASEMLDGCEKATNADATVCTTGIAGPSGGSEKKPVGLVYIGVKYRGEKHIKKCLFCGNREQVIKKATEYALSLLYKTVKENNNG